MNLIAAFLLGLAGSLHCAVMCGPLILAVNAARRQNFLQNVIYHAGRLVIYSFLGAGSGLIGAALVFAGFQRWISIAAGCLVLFALSASLRVKWANFPGRIVRAAKSRFGRLLQNRSPGATFLLGAVNGLLPCGLVYVACAAAATAASVAGGIATMLAFGLGTAPMLLSISVLGKMFQLGHWFNFRKIVPACAAIAGILLIVRGLSLGIPYLSPHYSAGHEPICGCHDSM